MAQQKKPEEAKEKKTPYIFQVATKPDISSYKWIDKEYSILSTVILWFVWLCRFFSLYQHIKALYRLYAEKKGWGATENLSGRPNIPPMMGELYFILWTTFFALMHVFKWEGPFFWGASVYYLFESVTWILYYTVFRRFFELGYSIYHKLEYLTAIAMLIPTQALCLSHLYGTTFREMLVGLLGAGGDSAPFTVKVLGAVFSAIVISMIISTFPMEQVKEKDTRPKMSVIGCGDVVKARLRPALTQRGTAQRVCYYDRNTDQQKQEPYCFYLDSGEEILEAIRRKMGKNEVVWVETPPQFHRMYLEELLAMQTRLVVMEKPVAVDPEDLDWVEQTVAREENRNRIFFLSYYILEKALPLYYLTDGKSQFEKYLEVDNCFLVNNWQELLGQLQSVDVHIEEGPDERPWANAPEGQKMETFLHNVLIAALFCDDPDGWTVERYTDKLLDGGVQALALDARWGDVPIRLSLKKNLPVEAPKQRVARIVYTGGVLEADFNKQSVKILVNGRKKGAVVAINNAYEQRYSVMVDLVDRVVKNECLSSEVDGLTDQLAALRWLLQLKKTEE